MLDFAFKGDDMECCEHENHERLLSDALLRVLQSDGMIRRDVVVSGPELLLAAEDYIKARDLVSP